jgi:hypothetical protein
MSTAPLDLALAGVSRCLHAFNGSFADLSRVREGLHIYPMRAARFADDLEADANRLITAARLLRHAAQLATV